MLISEQVIQEPRVAFESLVASGPYRGLSGWTVYCFFNGQIGHFHLFDCLGLESWERARTEFAWEVSLGK